MANKKLLNIKKVPNILIIGAGRFGAHHIRIWKDLESQGRVCVVGIVERNKKKHKGVESKFNLPVFADCTASLLSRVDAVDVVTPPETHFDIVSKCLPYVDVFVEKPLATNHSEALILQKFAKKYRRNLVVGHVFRYHPVAEKLKFLFAGKQLPQKISGTFINPINADQGREGSLELLHLFDVIDFLWKKEPELVSSRNDHRISVIDMRYSKQQNAHLILGWKGEEKKRFLSFTYPELTVEADFIANTITFIKGKTRRVYECPLIQEPLHKELYAFVTLLSKGNENNKNQMVFADTASRIVATAQKAISKKHKKPRVAVIGGGIFGTSIAAELAEFCSVTIFEKNNELMREGSHINQFRHHYGYHYPRSDETVVDIQRSRVDFEKIFNKAIIRTAPTYYGLARQGSFVSKKDFLVFCKKHKLPYKKAFPAHNLLSKKEIDLCIEVPEPSYHYERLKKITEQRLASFPNISVIYNTMVTGASLAHNGQKELSYLTQGKKQKKGSFDFIVNATYANINRLASWLDFEQCAIRVDLAEVLIVRLPIDPISITVIDGPFATLMPTGNKNEFTLYHVKESIIDRYVPENGLVKKPLPGQSNREKIFSESLKLFPILKDATIVESRIVHRGVQAYHEHDDARVADLIEHGFGCWSVLSGKILSSVRTGRRLREILKNSII